MTAPEDRSDPRVVQEVRRLVTARDRGAILEYITAIPPDDLTEATKWFAKGGRTILTKDLDWRLYRTGVTSDDMLIREFVRTVLILALNPPAVAAKALPWWHMESTSTNHVLTLLDILVAKGEDWCRRFVTAAMERNAKAGERPAIAVIRHCLPLILHFEIDTKELAAYPRLWAFYYKDFSSQRIHEVWNDEISAKMGSPRWHGLQFRIDVAGRAEVCPKMQASLLELCDLDVTAPQALMRCFDIPNALGPLKRANVGSVLDAYIQRGTVSRAQVLEGIRTALARSDGLPTQRVLSEILHILELAPEEVAVSVPLLLSAVATGAGFLSFQVLGLLLHAPLGGGDLQDLSVAVFGRAEKKPQESLVRHLKSRRTSQFYGAAVLAACWDSAAGSSDLKIRSTAESMLSIPPTAVLEEPAASASLWGTGTRQPPAIPLYVALEGDPARRLPNWNRQWEHSIVEEQYVDLFLREVYHVPQEVRDWYRRKYPVAGRPFPDGRRWANPSPETVLTMWASGGHDLAAHRNLTELFRASLSGPFEWDDPFRLSSPLAAIHTFRQSELAVQAGVVPYSLATPSYVNFRVELDRLVSLLRLYAREGWAYGEADLFQALLRLGPLDAQLAADVPELSVRPLDGSDDPERVAGRILRKWVGGGGFKPPPVDAPLTLPVPLEQFPSIPPELLSSELWNGGGRGYGYLCTWDGNQASAVVPFWPDLGAIWSRRRILDGGLLSLRPGGLAGATGGEIGQLTHDWIIASLTAPYQDRRDSAVETVLELAARRQLSAGHLAMAAGNSVRAGGPSLGRLVRSLALVAYEGHLDCIWPALTSLVVAASEQQKVPAVTPELLATCTELWGAIPAEHRTAATIPAKFTIAVVALAASKSATKTALEAKRLSSRMGLVPSVAF